MSHNAQQVYFASVKRAFPEMFKGTKVLEVGSLDLNGSVRHLFEEPAEYIGIDLDEGPGVDIAVQGQDYDGPDNYFDVTISAECFEHNPYWRETFINMVRVTRPGGLVTFTCAGRDRGEHGTHRSDPESSPLTVAAGWNYYRNLEPHDFDDEMLQGLDYRFTVNNWFHDLYFTGVKVSEWAETIHSPDWYQMRELDRINWYEV